MHLTNLSPIHSLPFGAGLVAYSRILEFISRKQLPDVAENNADESSECEPKQSAERL